MGCIEGYRVICKDSGRECIAGETVTHAFCGDWVLVAVSRGGTRLRCYQDGIEEDFFAFDFNLRIEPIYCVNCMITEEMK